jgi:hypothetical protein
MEILSIIFILFWLVYVFLLKFYEDKIINFWLKISDKKYKISEEHDCLLHNWLTEDNLNIEIPFYAYHLESKEVFSIRTPIGHLWIGNYPYNFGHKIDDKIRKKSDQPKDETKEKLFTRLVDLDLIYDKKRKVFKIL